MKGKKICPKCGSTNIGLEPVVQAMGTGLSKYECKDCGFDGFIFPEITKRKKRKS